MKPKDLKSPFTWAERRPAIDNRVLYVPEYYHRHHEYAFPGWSSPEVFGNSHPVFIEYCAGNGAWIANRAETNPDVNWVAVEIQFERARKIWSKVKNLNLKNLFVVCGEALTFTRYYIPNHSVEGIFVNFPDPWPKEKHAKKRLFQSEFVEEISRVVKKGGNAILVTDDPTYCGQMSTEMRRHPAWRPSYPDPYYITSWDDYGTSYFDQLFRQQSRIIHYLQFNNQKSCL